MTMRPNSTSQSGFSMLEVLIAMVISSVGLLGLAALQNIAQQQEFESYQRSQALIILQDMVSRLSANRQAARCYDITTDKANGSPWLGTSTTLTIGCLGWGDINSRARADDDLTAIDKELRGESVEQATVGGTTKDVGAIVGALACISYDTTADLYTLSVSWAGTNETFAPSVNCGVGQFGTSDKARRTVSTTVSFGTLL